jgi:outer membrane protein OmpA-like peptidoglycan-associated protein
LEENPKLRIEIHGHICCKIKGDVNGVSTARAKAIYSYLIRNKIDRKRMSFKGYGTTRPIYPIPEKNVLEEEENRRVEILIVEK